jgi:asparagine synthase (glutamine-hydrolysing)
LLAFNGEILNYRELAAKYGIVPAESDTDVLSILLERDDFSLDEIDGFFALVFVDNAGRLRHCARDRFGVKPMFVYRRGSYLTISSEASLLSDLASLSFKAEAMEEYEVFRAPIFEESFFEQVGTIAPGSCLVHGRYFESLDYVTGEYEDAPSLDELDTTFTQSVASRLISDVPVGLLFSGGIDSNLIDAYTNRALSLFTGGFESDWDIDAARKLTDGRSHIQVMDAAGYRELLAAMIEQRKEPLSVPNEVVLARLARNWQTLGGKVLLSGEAADEFFGGYDRIYGWASQINEIDIAGFLQRYAYVKPENINDRIKQQVGDFFSDLGDIPPFEKVRQFFVKLHLPVLFRRLDFALMFGGIEGREPFATFGMYKLALRYGPNNLIASGLGKQPLRELAARHLGREFAYQSKVGFPIDLAKIFGNSPSDGGADNYRIWRDENLRRVG